MNDLRAARRGQSGAVRLLDRSVDHITLRAVRHAVLKAATSAGLVDLALGKFVTAVHEVTVNAVKHGGGRGRVQIALKDAELWCRVTDAGPGIAPKYRTCRRQPAGEGRLGHTTGLWLAAQLCAEIHISDGPDGGAVVLLRYPLTALMA